MVGRSVSKSVCLYVCGKNLKIKVWIGDRDWEMGIGDWRLGFGIGFGGLGLELEIEIECGIGFEDRDWD